MVFEVAVSLLTQVGRLVQVASLVSLSMASLVVLASHQEGPQASEELRLIQIEPNECQNQKRLYEGCFSDFGLMKRIITPSKLILFSWSFPNEHACNN